MKLIHTADIHLGAVPDAGYPWAQERSEAIWETFARLIGRVRTEKADLLLISGDLFHAPPSRQQLERVNGLFADIPDTAVVLCAGNHDYLTRDSLSPVFDWSPNVTGLWSKELASAAIPGKDTRVYGLSYHDYEAAADLYAGAQPYGSEAFHILLMHAGDAKHSPFRREDLQAMRFDYIALGHIHKPGYLIKNRAAYCGALCPIDRNDTGEHGFLKAELNTAQPARVAFVPFAPWRYETITVQTAETDTVGAAEEKIRRALQARAGNDSIRVILEGGFSRARELDVKRLWNAGHVLEIEDHTGEAPDYAALLQRYPGTLLEAFIRSLIDRRDEAGRIALEEGTRAILEHMA